MIFQLEIDDISILSQGLMLIFLVLICIYLINMIRKLENGTNNSQKTFYLGLLFYVIINIINIVLFIIKLVLIRQGYPDPYVRYIKIGGTGYEFILFMLLTLSCVPLMYPIEKYILNSSNFIITKLNLTSFILLLVPYFLSMITGDVDTFTLVAYPGMGIAGIMVLISFIGSPTLYIKLGLNSVGSLRKKSFSIGFGLASMYIGLILSGFFNVSETLFFPHVLMALGALFTLRGFAMEAA